MKTETQAARAIRLINQLTHTKGPFAGQSFDLRPWQRRIVKALFKTRKDGRRQYRTCLLMLPRKNGKSELCAALAIYFLLFDGEIGAEVYSAAADKTQAALVFDVAAQMIRNDEELLSKCEIIDSQKRIVHRGSGSFYRAISAEAYSKHGFNASVVIYDELHVAPNRDLWGVLSTSQGARNQPLMMAISTAGYDRHSILYDLYSHAKKVQENPAIDPTFLPILYEAPEGADWTDEKVWKAVNPALGDFRSLEEMRATFARARQLPGEENDFRQLYLNQWVEQQTRWMSLLAWDACRAPIDRAALRGRNCYLGLDLSTTTDMSALVAIFPDQDGGYDVFPQFFIPADNIRGRVHRDRVPYDVWQQQGHLIATPGNQIDYQYIRRTVHDWAAEFQVVKIGFDSWNAHDLINQIELQDRLPVVRVPQNLINLSGPTKSLERAILGKHLRHDNHPILRWNAGNAESYSDGNENKRLVKSDKTERIDGMAALVNAVYVMDKFQAIPVPTYQFFALAH